MNQITITMNQIMPLLSLYSEFIACLVAASVLSLFAGWMLSRSSAKKSMAANTKSWERRFRKIEEAATADTDNLEEQLQELAGDTRTLKATNRVLTDSLRKNDATIQKARAEAIELNRQNAETQERLQRIIQQKEREIANSTNNSNPEADEPQDQHGSTCAPTKCVGSVAGTSLGMAYDDDLDEEFEATLSETIDTGPNDQTPESDVAAMNNADTIAFNPSDLFDSTLQMSADDFALQNRQLSLPDDSEFEDIIDDTADVSGMFMDDMEESTVALDDDSLAYAKRPFPVSNVD
ncbi:MAG: TolA-binding protein [Granulosicoccus sp.]|jgi:TolA-binding protein